MAKADKVASADFVIRPVEVDKKALSDLKGKRKVAHQLTVLVALSWKLQMVLYHMI